MNFVEDCGVQFFECYRELEKKNRFLGENDETKANFNVFKDNGVVVLVCTRLTLGYV